MANLGTLFDEWRVAIDSELKESTRDQKKLILTMAGYYVPELDSLSYPVNSIRRNFDWHTMGIHGPLWAIMINGIGAPSKSGSIIGDGSLNYDYIRKYLRSYKIDHVYNSTYVINYFTFGLLWVGFDDVEAVRAKVSYAKEKGLLGYNVWQVPDDRNWELSKAADAICICFADIREATNYFSKENKLGEGGYGPVYKGKLSNGQEIAVKRLSHSSKQGLEEFKNEVTFAAKLQHVSLVKLLGFCTEKEEKMLIYEYMPNKSLDFYIFDPRRRSMLNWEKWVEIIEGIIQGLLYFQEYLRLAIVHRDLKPSNILLDAHMKPRISDFGIAKSFQDNETEATTDRIVRTYGCVPPEYIKKAYVLWKEGSAMEFIDPSLDDTSST
ncbi:putative cysteine-rich receptor-like protein kinase 35 [Tanacetum coccineum]|uniref:Cysteine-rich receptor-like protein kinase 35 n=1 Tax=Tanacetum coccineum TaxID=301880 RepID=A0ABQ5ED53_9ASTR